MYKYLAIVFLFFSGCIGFTVQNFGQDLCISNYIAINTVTFFKELNGVSSNDPIILHICSLLAVIFSGILAFVKNKRLYLILLCIFTLSDLFTLTLFETVSFKEVLISSTFNCFNYSLSISAIFLILYWIFSLLFLIKSKT